MTAPTAAQVAEAYPAAAKAAHQTGKVVLDCKMQADGRLRACKVLVGRATPAGSGFGEAALKLTGKFTGYTSNPVQAISSTLSRMPIAFSDAANGAPKIVIGPTARGLPAADRQGRG